MRKHSPRFRFSALRRPLAAGLGLVLAAGCGSLRGAVDRVTPGFASALADPGAADEKTDDGRNAAEDAVPAPPTAPPADALAAAAAPAVADDTPAAALRTPETERLIIEELALAPPQERTQLAAEWATLDEAMVEQVIRIRRMVRQLDAAAVALPTPAAPAHSVAAARVVAPPPAGGTSFPLADLRDGGVGRVRPAAPHERPTPPRPPVPLHDSLLQPAAYVAPPVDRADGAPPPGASLFPGQPPSEAGEPTPLQPPPPRTGGPTRVAEALPSDAALRAPGFDSDGRGPSGFGGGPQADPDDFDGRLALLEQTARRRADRAAEAVRVAAGPEERVAAERQRAEAEVHLRLLHLIAGEHGRALEAVPGLPPAEQEFWQHTFWALSTELDTASIPDAADRATHAVAALRTAAVKLSERANLTLKDVNFCHRVDSFGNVQTFERDEFTPNEPVLIYAAVENFSSERTLKGRFRTVLRSKVEIFKAGGTELVQTLPLDKPMTEDLCDNHRQDYFLIYELKIPAIGLGRHVLKLTVEDTLSGATAETELNFTVR